MREKQKTYITIKLKDDYKAYMRQYMRKRRLVKKEGLHSYPITSVDARPYKKRNISVGVKPSKDRREYQRQYHRKYRKTVQKQSKIAKGSGTR